MDQMMTPSLLLRQVRPCQKHHCGSLARVVM